MHRDEDGGDCDDDDDRGCADDYYYHNDYDNHDAGCNRHHGNWMTTTTTGGTEHYEGNDSDLLDSITMATTLKQLQQPRYDQGEYDCMPRCNRDNSIDDHIDHSSDHDSNKLDDKGLACRCAKHVKMAGLAFKRAICRVQVSDVSQAAAQSCA